MRAPTDEIRERQRPYLEVLRGARAGARRRLRPRRAARRCCATREIEARGVDADADMVAFARGEGLDVEQADLLDALAAVAEESLGAVTALQVVEHLPPGALVRFLELALAGARPGGLLVAETINPASPAALRHYFADLTHAQPLVPETLELLARRAGFSSVELRVPERAASPMPTRGSPSSCSRRSTTR